MCETFGSLDRTGEFDKPRTEDRDFRKYGSCLFEKEAGLYHKKGRVR